MASPFKLKKEKSAGQAEYAKTLAKEMKRYGGDRDRAVRSANIASGYGSSTAERFKGGGKKAASGGGGGSKSGGGGGGSKSGGGGGGKHKPDRQKTSSLPPAGAAANMRTPSSAPSPSMTSPSSAPGFLPNMTSPSSAPGFLPNMTTPTSAPGFLREAPPMPPPLMGVPPDLRAANGPLTMGGPTQFPPDLAVSPRFPPDPMAGSAPTGPITFNSALPKPSPPPLFNSYGMKSEPQDPNEPWWKAALRG